MLSKSWEQMWAAAGIDNAYQEALRMALPAPAAEAAGQRASPLAALPGLCCAAAAGERQDAEALAAAWTLLYRTLHLLDSLEDGDEPEAPWMRWGPGAAINVSTGLLASLGWSCPDWSKPGRAMPRRRRYGRTSSRRCSG